MARLVTVAAVLLAALPVAFVQAVSPNICSEMPYALLQDFEPAKEWCSSHSPDTTATVVVPAHCGDGDVPCSVFSDLRVADVTLASDVWYVLFCWL
jgi:hypothetical protein